MEKKGENVYGLICFCFHNVYGMGFYKEFKENVFLFIYIFNKKLESGFHQSHWKVSKHVFIIKAAEETQHLMLHDVKIE